MSGRFYDFDNICKAAYDRAYELNGIMTDVSPPMSFETFKYFIEERHKKTPFKCGKEVITWLYDLKVIWKTLNISCL